MSKSKNNDARFLAMLQRVLPKTVTDPHQVNATYEEVSKEVRLARSLEAFEKFCEKGSIPDLEEQTVKEMHDQLAGNFGEANVKTTPAEDGSCLEVEITTAENIISSKIKVVKPGEEDAEAEAPYVPFPVARVEDPELIWLLARRENLGPDDAARALFNMEEEFWATKQGQNLQRQGVEKSFAEFISNAPASLLKESGIKRYSKDPETLKVLGPQAVTTTEEVA